MSADDLPARASDKTIRLSDQSGVREVARVAVGACSWCRQATEGLAVVGIIHSSSGAGWDISACEWCIRRHALLPLDDHPERTWGTPLHRDGSPADIPVAEQ